MVSSSIIKSVLEKENAIKALFSGLVGFGFITHFLLIYNPFSAANAIKFWDSLIGSIKEKMPSLCNSLTTASIKSENDKVSVCRALFLSELGDLVESIKNGGLQIIVEYFLVGLKS
jgi:hypothetical protein